ncbi:MAG: hypothetical protein MJZ86_10150 [Bacteroidales bacterium]|nr:hypothetical protein [Bacteroidales bacterium]
MELILNTFGTTLSRDTEGFVIVNSEGRQRIPAEGIKTIQSASHGSAVSSEKRMYPSAKIYFFGRPASCNIRADKIRPC